MAEIAKSNEEEEPVDPAPAASPPEVNPIEEAKKVLEETKATLAKITEERKRIEKATAEMLVNGRSYAGQEAPKLSEEQKKKEGAIEFFKGSEIEKAIRKHG